MTAETTTEATSEPPSLPTAYDTLAWQSRDLAEQAERIRDLIAASEDPTQITDELRDAHAHLEESARAVLPLVGESRRSTYTVLRERMAVMEIVKAFGLGSYQAVANVLAGRRSASKRKRKTEEAEDQ